MSVTFRPPVKQQGDGSGDLRSRAPRGDRPEPHAPRERLRLHQAQAPRGAAGAALKTTYGKSNHARRTRRDEDNEEGS